MKNKRYRNFFVLLFVTLLVTSHLGCAPTGNDDDNDTEDPQNHTTLPPLKITLTPPPSEESDVFFSNPKGTEVSLEFSCTQGCTTYCKVDHQPYQACSSPYEIIVSTGQHTFSVRGELNGETKEESETFYRVEDPISMTPDSAKYPKGQLPLLKAQCNLPSSVGKCDVSCEATDGTSTTDFSTQCTSAGLDFNSTINNDHATSATFKLTSKITLGDKTYTKQVSKEYTIVPLLWESIASSSHTTCAIRNDNTMWCWGSREHGIIPDGGGNMGDTTPIQIPGKWNSVVLSDTHGCGIDGNYDLKCWGSSQFGVLGDGSTTPTEDSNPKKVAPPETGGEWSAHSLTLSDNHTCAEASSSSSPNSIKWYCWGKNDNNILRVQDSSNQVTRPSLVTNVEDNDAKNIAKILVTDDWIAYLVLKKFSPGSYGESNIPRYVYTYGENNEGQLGIGNNTSTNTPTKLAKISSGFPNIVLSIASSFACGDFSPMVPSLLCWGSNSFGQIAQPIHITASQSPSAIHPAIDGTTNFSSFMVSKKGEFVCGLSDGNVYCWGNNQHNVVTPGTAGAPKIDKPTQVTLPVKISQITTGINYACAITQDQKDIYCWGDPSYKHLGKEISTNTNVTKVDFSHK